MRSKPQASGSSQVDPITPSIVNLKAQRCWRLGNSRVMMKRLLALQLTLLLLFGTATGAVIFLGRLNRHPAEQIIMVKWDQDARACWNSICPGQTMLGD